MIDIKKPTPVLNFRNAMVPLKKAEKIILHHMAHKTAGIHDVHAFHRNKTFINSAGKTAYWSGIGYNYWIAFDGTTYEARGLNVGAHTSGWNDKAIGIGFQGNFEEQKMPDEQLQGGAALCRKLLVDYFLAVEDTVGHKNLSATLCPGKYFRLGEIKELACSLADSRQNGALYTVQVGSFKVKENALNMLKELRKQGYEDAYINITI